MFNLAAAASFKPPFNRNASPKSPRHYSINAGSIWNTFVMFLSRVASYIDNGGISRMESSSLEITDAKIKHVYTWCLL